MQFPSKIYKRAGLKSTDIAGLVGVSRVTGHRWLNNAGVNIFLREKVAATTEAVWRAVSAKALPDRSIAKLPPDQRLQKLESIIRNYTTN